MYVEWYGVWDFVVFWVVEICVDDGGVCVSCLFCFVHYLWCWGLC